MSSMADEFIEMEYCPRNIPSTTIFRMLMSSDTAWNKIAESERRRMTECSEEVEFVYQSDDIKMLKKGDYEDDYNATQIAIVELICKIRELDAFEFNEIHPLIDDILEVDDTQWERLNELYKQTKTRRQKGIYPPYRLPDYFAFKTQDRKGRIHMVNCDTISLSLAELTNAVVSKLGDEVDRNNPPKILYKRDEGDVQPDNGDKVVIESDSDLIDAVYYAISAKWDILKLHLEYSATPSRSSSRVSSVIQRLCVVTLPVALGFGILVLHRKFR